ncbi:MAG: Mu transposase C-terminal domain-containing protein [Janthinobacterium lividum]
MTPSIKLLPGSQHLYQGHRVKLLRVLDLQYVIVEYSVTGATERCAIHALKPIPATETGAEVVPPTDDIFRISDEAWGKAQHKLAILQPILADRGNAALVEAAARTHQISTGSLYRWLRCYDQTGSVISLVERPRLGGKGQSRVTPQLEEIIRDNIELHYKTSQKKPATKVYLEIQEQCRSVGLTPPGLNTVRRRIQQLSEREKVRTRWSKKMAREQFDPIKGETPGADFPLALVQIDHTLVDLILVDEQYRKPLARPHLTVALDVHSRMILGFYVSFDPPGAIGTGLCLAQAILPKEGWLSRMSVQGDWPCWGVPTALHTDNAKEFRGTMLQRACEKYGMRQDWRPAGTPHFGGHVERVINTFMQEVHTLSGTTFSNVQDRKDYPSEEKAILTLREFEQWLTTYIVDVYHKRIHSAINMRPYDRYKEGIFGSPTQPGIGLPERLYDEHQVYLDFMPAEERTIQEYGVVIDHVHYYADVLKPYINTLEVSTGKQRVKRKFLFKRDPRDISCLYFLDPATQQYHRIPYRNTAHPPMSVWEFRQARELARSKGLATVDADGIFAGYAQMREVEVAAATKTKKMTKLQNRLIQGVPLTSVSAFFQQEAIGLSVAQSQPTTKKATARQSHAEDEEATAPAAISTITPFHGLYDASSFAPEYGETA